MKTVFRFKLSILLFFIITTLSVSAQSKNNDLIEVKSDSADKIFVLKSSVKLLGKDEIHAWTLQLHNIPLTIESVDEKIYKTKTNYLLNKDIKKYGLLEVIYYDEDDNVLKSFTYKKISEITNYKYNFPIIPGSDMQAVLDTCLNLLEN